MDQVTRNVLRHVYEALLSRPRMADSGNISNLQLFYNRLISEHCASDKKGQLLVVPLTGQDVDDFYSRKMKREQFVEVIRSKVSVEFVFVTRFNQGYIIVCLVCRLFTFCFYFVATGRFVYLSTLLELRIVTNRLLC